MNLIIFYIHLNTTQINTYRTFSSTLENFLMPLPSQSFSKQILIWFLFDRLILLILEFHIESEYIFFCVLFLSVSVKILRSILAVFCDSSLFILNCWAYFIYEYITIYLPIDEHLCCFHLGPITKKAAINIHAGIFFVDLHFHFSWVNIQKWNSWVTN